MEVLFVILVFLAVTGLFVGLALRSRDLQAEARERRLSELRGRERYAPRREAMRDERYSAIPWLDNLLRRLNLGQRIEMFLYQSGLSMRGGMLVLLIAVFAVGGYTVGLVLFHRLFAAFLFMALAAPLPYFYVRYRKQQRMNAFAREFPDALDLLVSALRAGLSFSAAMQIVAEESPDPVRGEFAVTVEEQGLGLDFRESLMNLSSRVDSLDLRFFVTAVILQRETGGNLAEVLENIAALIRDRFRILGDIRTFTVQGKMTGAILGSLPLLLGLFTFLSAPEYFKPMIESDGGRAALWFAALAQLAGFVVIRKIVSIRV